ncbi:hypothetical protein ACOSQ2_026658 [Xanthoceras sorbifolium]
MVCIGSIQFTVWSEAANQLYILKRKKLKVKHKDISSQNQNTRLLQQSRHLHQTCGPHLADHSHLYTYCRTFSRTYSSASRPKLTKKEPKSKAKTSAYLLLASECIVSSSRTDVFSVCL